MAREAQDHRPTTHRTTGRKIPCDASFVFLAFPSVRVKVQIMLTTVAGLLLKSFYASSQRITIQGLCNTSRSNISLLLAILGVSLGKLMGKLEGVCADEDKRSSSQQPAASSGGPASQRASATGKIVHVVDKQDALTGCGTCSR
jgi:hypothetical protein